MGKPLSAEKVGQLSKFLDAERVFTGTKPTPGPVAEAINNEELEIRDNPVPIREVAKGKPSKPKSGRGPSRSPKTIPIPLEIACVKVRHMVFLNDGRPVLIQGANSTMAAYNRVQAMIDAGKL